MSEFVSVVDSANPRLLMAHVDSEIRRMMKDGLGESDQIIQELLGLEAQLSSRAHEMSSPEPVGSDELTTALLCLMDVERELDEMERYGETGTARYESYKRQHREYKEKVESLREE